MNSRKRGSAPPVAAGLGCMSLFFGVFALVGLGALWVMGIQPLLKAMDARSWVETPAEVASSNVERHSGSKGGSTYSVAITFDYVYGGQRYHGTNYDFQTGSSSGTSSKQAVVDRFPVGAKTTCWVNPKAPSEAVIDRNVGWWILFGLFPLIFLGAGLGGIVFVLAAFGARRKMKAASAVSPGSEIRPS